MNTSAVMGFTNTLFDLLKTENPSHIAVCFDTFAPTKRHVEFKEYKANRQETPEDILQSIPYIKEIITGFRIPILELDGYEADDIIGTLAKRAEKKGFDVYMVTPDKDFGQLVSENVFMYKPNTKGGGFEVLGLPEILKKWSIKNTDQVIDILGLWGDSVDNIPGIPGIGEKTAKKLVSEYGSVEGIIENADKLQGKLQDKVKEHAEQAILSKKLATIILDTPIKVTEKEFLRVEMDKDKLSEIFAELEFKGIGKRIIGESFSTTGSVKPQMDMFDEAAKNGDTAPGKRLENTTHKYHLIDEEKMMDDLVAKLLKSDAISFHTETIGTDPNQSELIGLAFSVKAHEAYYVPLENKATLSKFKPVFEKEGLMKIGQNIKFHLLGLKWNEIELRGPYFDTMLAHYLIEPEANHNIERIAEIYFNYEPIALESVMDKKDLAAGKLAEAPPEERMDYVCERADLALQLKEKLTLQLKKAGTEKLFNEVEIPLMTVLADMEFEGVGLQTTFLEDYSKVMKKEIVKNEKEVYKIAGTPFNLASPKQLGEILFEKMKIPYEGKKTKTGQYSTNEEVLTKLAEDHEIAEKITAYREWSKLKSTYVDALPVLINPKTKRIHTSFNQAVAATGRLSSADPNLQNIPIRTDRGREIRKAFIPRSKDHILLSADYSQVELRIVAAISKDKAMIDSFLKGQDIHTTTAAKVYNVELEDVTTEMRRNAKMVNFGIVYGISAFGLSQRLRIPRAEGKTLIDEYFILYPNVKKFMEASIEFARKKGYVETLMGRRRYLRDINSRNYTVRGYAERNAINAPIQGSAADLIKIAMINIHSELIKGGYISKMILQVHDELLFDVHKKELNDIKPMIGDKMKNAMDLGVPIELEMGEGSNWLEAH